MHEVPANKTGSAGDETIHSDGGLKVGGRESKSFSASPFEGMRPDKPQPGQNKMPSVLNAPIANSFGPQAHAPDFSITGNPAGRKWLMGKAADGGFNAE